jgi:hypothetical protein
MTKLIQQIVSLGETLAVHIDKSHWSVSSKVSSKSDLLHRLQNGGDVSTRTYEKTILRFSEIWPEDLEWPRDIARPKFTPEKRKAS